MNDKRSTIETLESLRETLDNQHDELDAREVYDAAYDNAVEEYDEAVAAINLVTRLASKHLN